jgi:hypothetical protein
MLTLQPPGGDGAEARRANRTEFLKLTEKNQY